MFLATLPIVQRHGGEYEERQRPQQEQHDPAEEADPAHHGRPDFTGAARM
jgi:hypothetical protein